MIRYEDSLLTSKGTITLCPPPTEAMTSFSHATRLTRMRSEQDRVCFSENASKSLAAREKSRPRGYPDGHPMIGSFSGVGINFFLSDFNAE